MLCEPFSSSYEADGANYQEEKDGNMPAKRRVEDYIGKQFHRLTIIKQTIGKDTSTAVLVKCCCGSEKTYKLSDIINGYRKSCGCINNKHHLTRTTEYRSWQHMKARCYTKTNNKYNEYGARGITVCERWRNSFENFIEDMGKKPGKGYTIDRINNGGNYESTNCKWSTAKEQANNKSNNILTTIEGITLNRTQWVEKLGLNYDTIQSRLWNGWSEEKAITTPVNKYKK